MFNANVNEWNIDTIELCMYVYYFIMYDKCNSTTLHTLLMLKNNNILLAYNNEASCVCVWLMAVGRVASHQFISYDYIWLAYYDCARVCSQLHIPSEDASLGSQATMIQYAREDTMQSAPHIHSPHAPQQIDRIADYIQLYIVSYGAYH